MECQLPVSKTTGPNRRLFDILIDAFFMLVPEYGNEILKFLIFFNVMKFEYIARSLGHTESVCNNDCNETNQYIVSEVQVCLIETFLFVKFI